MTAGGGVVLLLSTAPPAAAAALAEQLLRERLVACVNLVGPVRSQFWWGGAVDHADEMLLLCKTTAELLPRARDRLVELHEYDVPEVLAFPVADGHAPYLDWVAASVGASGGEPEADG